MAITLIHDQFKTLIDGITGIPSYPVYLPETSEMPAIVYSMESVSRDIESNLRNTTVSAHVFNVNLVATTFIESHQLAVNLLSQLDQYSDGNDGNFLLVLIEDATDSYDPDQQLFVKSLVVTVRIKE